MSRLKDANAEQWRLDEIELLQQEYPEFVDFLYDGITALLGFDCTWLQEDIGKFLQYGPDNLMIQAQRSQAKTTITAFYVVWSWIHNPSSRALIFSAGGDMASEIAKWIIQIVENWDILGCLLPDRGAGDRASTTSYDVHWLLKGPEKSPSVACMGITASMQGRRADLLIADDVESSKNGMTALQRDQLLQKTRDFPSICQSGRIIYLGTPQSIDSIYNTLPGRGYEVRIWPGRFPTLEEEEHYGTMLAPSLRAKLAADPTLREGGGPCGDRGKPTDPVLLPEEALTKKEIDQGPAYFQLQHMLDTRLADNDRYPLKLHDLIVMDVPEEHAPVGLVWARTDDSTLPAISGFPLSGERLYGPMGGYTEHIAWEGRAMYVDTAGGGQNGDETVAAITYYASGRIFLKKVASFPGGIRDDVFEALTELCFQHRVQFIQVEQNFGNGAFAAAWRHYLHNVFNKTERAQYIVGQYRLPGIEDVWETGQKELRIIDCMEPVMARHALVVDTSVFEDDVNSTGHYPIDKRTIYQFSWQLARITRDRGSLSHDDRIDAVAGAVRVWVQRMAVDEHRRIKDEQKKETVNFFQQWDPTFARKGPVDASGHIPGTTIRKDIPKHIQKQLLQQHRNKGPQ